MGNKCWQTKPRQSSNFIIKEKNKNNRINECFIQTSSFEKMEANISVTLKSVCKIKIETALGTKYGTGFLFKFWIEQECFYCLITNEHVISNDIISNNNIIYIHYDSEYKVINIQLNKNERYIKTFIDIGLDITVVEILDKDNISKDYFLLEESRNINNLINSEIYIPQFAKGKELVYANGIIKEINNYEFTHLASTDQGSSGSPIFLKNRVKVIGIHKQSNVDKTENYGDFIYPIIDLIKEDIYKRRNNGKYINGKYIWDDSKYYIGEFMNNIPNGYGIKYYSNGNILYEGYFMNGKFEGNGKYIYDDGDYFIGQFKNGLRHGNGTLHYKNGNIAFEGEYINGKSEGNGKYIYENGNYYIGQWKNGLKNGKGIMYYSNGKIMYEGDWINDKPEGIGKRIYDNNEYFIGNFKRGLRIGKGIYYYSNGKIKYEGDWVNDKPEGNGKYIYEDGEYYIGQFKNGLKHGKGTEYYSDSSIKCQGYWVDDEFIINKN